MVVFNKFKKMSILFLISALFFSTLVQCQNISTCDDLQNISLNLRGNYSLTGDVDCFNFSFSPLGTFNGSLQGNGFRINNLTIVGGIGSTEVGMITITHGATICNIIFEDFTVVSTNSTHLALVVAYAVNSTFENVTMTSSPSFSNNITGNCNFSKILPLLFLTNSLQGHAKNH